MEFELNCKELIIIKNNKLVLFTILLVAGIWGAVALTYLNSAPDRQNDILFTIQPGESLSRIANNLKTNNLIRSVEFFSFMARILRVEHSIKSGVYNMHLSLTSIGLLRLFDSGKQTLFKITIPEGLTVNQIANRLEKQEIVGKQDFLAANKSNSLLAEFKIPAKSFEGYLYPDTYFFSKQISAELIIKIMVQNFFNKLYQLQGDKSATPEATQKLLILASIIEREYKNETDAPLISSVFTNRLEKGMPLQSCATVVYSLTENLGKPHPQRIFNNDLKIDDPYNTYRYKGLPPGPISSPGLAAIKAAMNPPKTQYLFLDWLIHKMALIYSQRVLASISMLLPYLLRA